MKKIILSSLLLAVSLFGFENLKPTYSLVASGDVQDIVYSDGKLYAATSESIVDIFDTNNKSIVKQIKLPQIKDFMGDDVPAKIYSIDILNNDILLVSQGMKGYRNVWLYSNNKLEKKIDIDKKLFIKEAKFINSNTIILATLANQIMSFDINNNTNIYSMQVSPSSFSHFVLSENRTKIVTTDESGIVRVLDSKSGIILKKYDSMNLDKVYQLDYKNGIVLTAGQDRKSVIYKNNKSDFLEFNFLLYSCGLSPSGTLGAVAYNENNDVLVFDTNSKKKLYNLTENRATLTQILFIDENNIFTTSDSSKINFYKLK